MRKLGMIGGMSWVSTRRYYERINTLVHGRVGRRSSAPLLIESLDFEPLRRLKESDDWDRAADVLAGSARTLEKAGAKGLIIAANSMHKVFDQVQAAVDIPILHIAECVGERMKASECKNAALLGTRNVMTESFYRRRLVEHGIDLMPPDMEFVDEIDRIIYRELMEGEVKRDSQRTLKSIITRKAQDGAEAIVLACTELEMIVDVDANVLPIFDSAGIHCDAAVDWMLGADAGQSGGD